MMNALRDFRRLMIKAPLRLITKVRRVPTDPVESLKIDTSQPIYYLMRTRSASNTIVLKMDLRALTMPAAKQLENNTAKLPTGTQINLQRRKTLFSRNTQLAEHRAAVEVLIQRQKDNPDINIQLVPVSVFWGRNPGKEQSLWRILFSDIEGAGSFWRAMIILFQSRQCFIQYGRPISLADVVTDTTEPRTTARKIGRIMRVHFNRQWVAAMGPTLVNRKSLLKGIVAAESVREVIRRDAEKSNQSIAKVEKKAYGYADEIAANYKYTTVRLLESLLTKFWNKIYDGVTVKYVEPVRELAKDHELVYVPCHRSHIDYLLLSYLLYREGLVPPHIAAGINLNFWPVGGLLRRGGAFFIRRSFSGNKLYTAVFNEYLYRLFNQGTSVEFFAEGGRSRTGRLLRAKTGMISMTVQSVLRGCKKPIVFVPVYVGYDRLFEGNSYLSELRGKQKKDESFGQLLGVRKSLKRKYGKVDVIFGEPLLLNQYLDDKHPDWRDSSNSEERPSWLAGASDGLGQELMQRVNASASLTSVNLVSLILLATPRHALPKNELIQQLDIYLELATNSPYSERLIIPQVSGTELVEEAVNLGQAQQISDRLGDVILIEGDEAVLSTYYANNIIHLFILPGLIASLFVNDEELERAEILERLELMYPLVQAELTLHWSSDEVAPRAEQLLAVMDQAGLLHVSGNQVLRPSHDKPGLSQLMLLAQVAQPTLHRFGIVLSLLCREDLDLALTRSALESTSQKLAQRVSVLHGINAPEFFDKNIFREITQALRDKGWLVRDKNQNLQITPELSKLQHAVVNALTLRVQQSLIQTIRALPSESAEPSQADSKTQETVNLASKS